MDIKWSERPESKWNSHRGCSHSVLPSWNKENIKWDKPSTPRRWPSCRADFLRWLCICCWGRKPHRRWHICASGAPPPAAALPRPILSPLAGDRSGEKERGGRCKWLKTVIKDRHLHTTVSLFGVVFVSGVEVDWNGPCSGVTCHFSLSISLGDYPLCPLSVCSHSSLNLLTLLPHWDQKFSRLFV